MLDRLGLYKEIKAKIMSCYMDRKWAPEICNKLYLKYDIPAEITSDLLLQKTSLKDTYDAIVFCMAKEMDIIYSKYFTESEIKEFDKYKYEKASVSFPYVFDNMVEVSEGKQYIGKITVKQLMELRDSQILNYNVNTQRQMKLKTGNNFSYYQIALNRKAVDQITKLLNDGDFIANTITLNINPATNFTFSDGKLKIKEEVKFDILDGYHRYIALSNIYNLNKNFDFTMELRVTFFREEIAKQFIFQEDQKTKLAKIDSEAMDKNSVCNKICRELTDMIKDSFNATNIMRQGVLAKMIQLVYVGQDKNWPYAKINAVATQIFKAIRSICLDVPDIMDKPWSDTFTAMFLVVSKNEKIKGKRLYIAAMELTKDISIKDIDKLTPSKLNKLLQAKGGGEYVV